MAKIDMHWTLVKEVNCRLRDTRDGNVVSTHSLASGQ